MNAATSQPSKPRRIAILAYEGCMGTEIFGVADVLRIAGHIARATSSRRMRWWGVG